MPKFKAIVYVGPCWVKQLADKFREAGINVIFEGTEYLHIEVFAMEQDSVVYNVIQELQQVHKTDFGLAGVIRVVRQINDYEASYRQL